MFSRARSCRQGAHDHRSTLFQEHLDVAYEWLVVRSGDACHGYPKGRVGAFHSGSVRAQWDVPQHHHLEFLHRVTELGPFGGMHIDAFETRDECLLVNVLQASFGAIT